MDDLLLSHVDTLTRSGSSKTLLPQIKPQRQGPSPLESLPNQKQLEQQIEKYFPNSPNNSGTKTLPQERIKFHDFSCAHGRLEDLEKTL